MAEKRKVFALTICAYRKSGMDEEAYHSYMSDVHAKSVNDLMVKNKIVAYSMVSATTACLWNGSAQTAPTATQHHRGSKDDAANLWPSLRL